MNRARLVIVLIMVIVLAVTLAGAFLTRGVMADLPFLQARKWSWTGAYVPHGVVDQRPWQTAATLAALAQSAEGAAHAGGGEAGVADGSYKFATRIGGGIDVPLSARFAVRIIQIDYYLTTFANATNNHQNNLLVGAGIVYHWSRQK
jgi:hypothetical protein